MTYNKEIRYYTRLGPQVDLVTAVFSISLLVTVAVFVMKTQLG